ncbi:MAG: oligosaccharide flippase family protein [Pseudomonadales bacterium]|nr:oligosaccharide flippase family protein [Pseudomonadales bacterium]MBO7004803.1 oligosaccharide flippase family protein [Pseudomonadales bacterium]
MSKRRSIQHLSTLLVDQGLRIVIQLIMNPILLAFVGPSLFGFWHFLNRSSTFVALVISQPTQSLRMLVAINQSEESDTYRQKTIGIAINLWALVLPVAVVLCLCVVLTTQYYLEIPDGSSGELMIVATLLLFVVLLRELAVLPNNVIAAMNKTHRLLGIKSGSQLINALVTVTLLWLGYGLVSAALGFAAGTMLLGVCGFVLARRLFPWFKVQRASLQEARSQLRFNRWYFLCRCFYTFFLTMDVLIIGVLAGASSVTSFVLCSFAAMLIYNFGILVSASTFSSFGELSSRDHNDRLTDSRRITLLILWYVCLTAGLAVVVLNRPFLTLWVGADYHLGSHTDVVIVVSALALAIARIDQNQTALSDLLREQVLALTLVALGVLAISYFAYGILGLIGLLSVFAIARVLMLVLLDVLVNNGFTKRLLFDLWRLSLFILLSLLIGTTVSLDWIDSWIMLVLVTGPVIMSSGLLVFLLLFDKAQRLSIFTEFRAFLGVVLQSLSLSR